MGDLIETSTGDRPPAVMDVFRVICVDTDGTCPLIPSPYKFSVWWHSITAFDPFAHFVSPIGGGVDALTLDSGLTTM